MMGVLDAQDVMATSRQFSIRHFYAGVFSVLEDNTRLSFTSNLKKF